MFLHLMILRNVPRDPQHRIPGSKFFVYLERGYEARCNLKNCTEEDNRGLYCVKYEICQNCVRMSQDWVCSGDVLGAILLWGLEHAPADGGM